MTSKALILLAVTGVLGVWLFLQVYGEHQATSRATETRMERERAEFDARFARAFDGKADPRLEQRAEDARKAEKLAKLDAENTKKKVDQNMQIVGERVDQQTKKLMDAADQDLQQQLQQ